MITNGNVEARYKSNQEERISVCLTRGWGFWAKMGSHGRGFRRGDGGGIETFHGGRFSRAQTQRDHPICGVWRRFLIYM